MFKRLAALFRRSPPPRYGIHDPYLQGLVEQSLAASAARIQRWEFELETMTIDPETARREQLLAALEDCQMCCAIEYPETEDGYGRAIKRVSVLQDALWRRFPDVDEAIAAIGKRACQRALGVHGGPRAR